MNKSTPMLLHQFIFHRSLPFPTLLSSPSLVRMPARHSSEGSMREREAQKKHENEKKETFTGAHWITMSWLLCVARCYSLLVVDGFECGVWGRVLVIRTKCVQDHGTTGKRKRRRYRRTFSIIRPPASLSVLCCCGRGGKRVSSCFFRTHSVEISMKIFQTFPEDFSTQRKKRAFSTGIKIWNLRLAEK